MIHCILLLLMTIFIFACKQDHIRLEMQKETGLIIPDELAILKQNETEDNGFYIKTVQCKILIKSDIDFIKHQIINSKQFKIENVRYKFNKANVRQCIKLDLDTLSGIIKYSCEEKL